MENRDTCTDMIRKFSCSLSSFVPNLGMFDQCSILFSPINLVVMTGPLTRPLNSHIYILSRMCFKHLKSSHYPEIYKFHAYRWHSTFKCQCFCNVFWSSFWNFQRITLRLTKINICQKCLINYTKLAAKVESRNLCKWLNSRLLNPLVPNKSWFYIENPSPFVNKLRFSTNSSHTFLEA